MKIRNRYWWILLAGLCVTFWWLFPLVVSCIAIGFIARGQVQPYIDAFKEIGD